MNASTVTFVGAAQQTINFDFGTSLTDDPTSLGQDGTTQFATTSVQLELRQNGYAAGSVAGISIAGDGTITGAFSNGQQRVLGQVVTADFANVNGLERTGAGLWIAASKPTLASSPPPMKCTASW